MVNYCNEWLLLNFFICQMGTITTLTPSKAPCEGGNGWSSGPALYKRSDNVAVVVAVVYYLLL